MRFCSLLDWPFFFFFSFLLVPFSICASFFFFLIFIWANTVYWYNNFSQYFHDIVCQFFIGQNKIIKYNTMTNHNCKYMYYENVLKFYYCHNLSTIFIISISCRSKKKKKKTAWLTMNLSSLRFF